MKVLITGITGMVGSHLADYIIDQHPECDVHGLVRWRSPTVHIDAIMSKLTLHNGDLRDLASLIAIMEKVRPDRIFHLAAQSYVSQSFDAPADTLNSNIVGTCNLLDAIRLTGISPRIHVCSSSEVYGNVSEDEVPIGESNPLRPASPYAVSKVGEDMIAAQYHLSYGMDIIRTRMFTHTGPRRGDVFAESSFALQIAQIEAGLKPNPVFVGNLDSVRTLSDVRDAVQAYWMLLEKCTSGEVYNIGGTETFTIGEILDILISLSTTKIDRQVDPDRLRPSDVTLQIPDTSKFAAESGWRPMIPARQTLQDLLDYQRERVRPGSA